MSCEQADLFWSLLERGNFEQLKRCNFKNFNWSALNPDNKTTVLVTACGLGFTEESSTKKRELLDIIGWLIRSGASCSQKCGKTDKVMQLTDEWEQSVEVPYSGHTVLSYIRAWQNVFQDGEDESEFLDKVLDVIAKALNQQTRPRVAIDEGIVELWERYLQASRAHDLTIQASDGCVTCHAQMLMEASPVVQAMLGSPMKEGTNQKIQLQDTSSSAVQLFVDVLYTCSSQTDAIEWNTGLSALDLAHRWQVEAVVAILVDLVQSMITEESFSAIAEQAALKGLDQLTKQCQKFAAENTRIQEQIRNGQLPKVVQELFQDPPKALATKKRKRL